MSRITKEQWGLPSKTQAHFAQQTNIHNIVAKFRRTGELPQAGKPVFMDLTEVPDLKASMNRTIEITQAFERLPAVVRREMDNNPQKMLDFVANPANRDRAKALGLLGDPPPVEPSLADQIVDGLVKAKIVPVGEPDKK